MIRMTIRLVNQGDEARVPRRRRITKRIRIIRIRDLRTGKAAKRAEKEMRTKYRQKRERKKPCLI
jgi:hypothetical protein